MVKKLEDHLIYLKNKLYLLEDEVDKNIRERIINSEKKFDKVKSEITKNAESLFQDINIFEKIK